MLVDHLHIIIGRNVYSNALPILKLDYLIFFLLNYRNPLYILHMNPLLDL